MLRNVQLEIRKQELGIRNEESGISNQELEIINKENSDNNKSLISNATPSNSQIFSSKIIPDETLLFQYSALGFNSHKIHLDREYAQRVEGLPDLVVNGGLATLLVTEYARIELKFNLSDIKVKHLAPLYCNRPLTIYLENDQLKIYNDKNEIAITVEISYQEAGNLENLNSLST